MGARGASAQVKWGCVRGVTAQPRGILLCGEGRIRLSLGRSVAAVELGGAECASVGHKAVDPAGALGERLAQHDGAAIFGRALAGRWTAIPDDVAGDEPLRDGP